MCDAIIDGRRGYCCVWLVSRLYCSYATLHFFLLLSIWMQNLLPIFFVPMRFIKLPFTKQFVFSCFCFRVYFNTMFYHDIPGG